MGHAAGATIDVQTRAGTSRFHGSVFDYQQTSALNARNFFDGARKPGLAQSQFGGNVGGPVRKAGGFFFANLELARERRGLTVISTVPSAAQKTGNFGSVPIYDPLTINEVRPVVFERLPFAGNQVPLARISTQARKLLALYPDPVLPGAFNNYRFTPDLVRSSDRLDVNYDKPLSSRNRLSAHLNYARLGAESPGALPAPAVTDSRLDRTPGATRSSTPTPRTPARPHGAASFRTHSWRVPRWSMKFASAPYG